MEEKVKYTVNGEIITEEDLKVLKEDTKIKLVELEPNVYKKLEKLQG